MAIALRELPGKSQALGWGQGLAGVAVGGPVGSNNLIPGTTLVPGAALGKGIVPHVPPEPLLSASSAPTHPQSAGNLPFSPVFPLLSPVPSPAAQGEGEERPLHFPSLWEQHSRGQRQLEDFPAALERTSWIQVERQPRVFIPRVP